MNPNPYESPRVVDEAASHARLPLRRRVLIGALMLVSVPSVLAMGCIVALIAWAIGDLLAGEMAALAAALISGILAAGWASWQHERLFRWLLSPKSHSSTAAKDD